MLLIAEIILTIFAWRAGWKWLSLLPVGIAFAIGLAIGASGGEISAGVIFVDIAAVIALIIMLVKPPKKEDVLVEPVVEKPVEVAEVAEVVVEKPVAKAKKPAVKRVKKT